MWNDTDIPLACLITLRCYGTWLHGDVRGSIDKDHNVYGSPYLEPNAKRESFSKDLLRSDPLLLNAARRRTVELAVREVCEIRRWSLDAINIRTNHLHVVASGAPSKTARRLFKSYATRNLKTKGLWAYSHSPWAGKGSRRLLWNEQSVQNAIDYVLYGQGDDLPDFD